MAGRALRQTTENSPTKELGESARLVYVIKMENTYGNKQPFTESIPSSQQPTLGSQQVDAPLSSMNTQLKNPFVIPGIRNLQIESQLNPNYNFDNFLEGDSNRLARSAGIAVANKPGGTSFNPLLIFGNVGLGKTHLAHATGVQKTSFPIRLSLHILKSLRSNTSNRSKKIPATTLSTFVRSSMC